MAAKPKSTTIEIIPLVKGTIRLAILGTSPLVMNRVAEKAQRELLLPAGRRRSKADRAGVLKHDPMSEYRNSAYRTRNADNVTRLIFPAPAFKAAMASAALDMADTSED